MWDDGFDVDAAAAAGSKADEVHVLRGLYAFGLERPSLVQQQVIVPIVNGWDVFFQSQPGTGTLSDCLLPRSVSGLCDGM
jgi:hypothetical protein